MTRSTVVAIALALLAATGCVRYRSPLGYAARTTGTCPGACTHYLSCKGDAGNQLAFRACVTECRGIFEDAPRALADYERLTCDDAVAFVEGTSGRGPGE